MADGEALYLIGADTGNLEKDLNNANSMVERKVGEGADSAEKKSSGIISKVGGAAKAATVAVGAAFVGATAAAVNYGSSFETAMAGASTLMDTNAVNLDTVKQKTLDLSNETGIAAEDLGNTMYNALSAGVQMGEDGADMMEYLGASAKLAKAGFTDIDTAASATAKVMNAYGMSVEDADKVQKVLMQTQNKGITTVGELGSVLSNCTPTAAAFGVSFENVGASIASMTAAGTPAATATTQLNGIIAELGKSGTIAATNLGKASEGTKYAGMSFSQMMDAGANLNEVLDMMNGYAANNSLTMVDMFSSVDAGKGALALCGENSAAFTENLQAMSTEMDVVGEAYDKVTDTPAAKFNEMMNSLKNSAIELFEGMLPIIDELLPVMQGLLEELVPQIMSLAQDLLPLIASAVESMLPLFTQMLEEFLPPFLDLLNDILPVLLDFVSQILPPLIELFSALLPPISQLISELLPPIIDLFDSLIPPLTDLITMLIPPLVELFNLLIPPIMEIVDKLLPPLIDLFNTLIPPIMEIISALLPPLVSLVESLLPLFVQMADFLTPLISLFVGLLQPILDIINSAIVPLIDIISDLIESAMDPLMDAIGFLADTFSERLDNVLKDVTDVFEDIKQIFMGIVEFIQCVFAGDWEGAWNSVVEIFDGIVSGITDIFKVPLNWVIDGINGFIGGLNKIKIPDWVPVVGGKGFHINAIPRLKKGMDFVPSDYFPSYLDYGERVLTQEENIRFNALGGLDGMEAVLSAGQYSKDQKVILGKGCIVVQSNLDGRTVAEATAPYMDEELGDLSGLQDRGV